MDVACGVLIDGERILIARRPQGKIGAGKWEFPGGKIEPGETPQMALVRELNEELGVRVTASESLARLRHSYRDRTIRLDTWRVDLFQGVPRPCEGQQLAWVRPADAARYDLLASSWRVLSALQLPRHYVVTPPLAEPGCWLPRLGGLPAGAWLRLRRPGLGDDAYTTLAARVASACRSCGVALVVDRVAALGVGRGAAGLHLNGRRLSACETRPVGHDVICIASVHNAREVARAHALGMDAVVLSPLRPTTTHPQAAPLGPGVFREMVAGAGLPVYALGGVGPADLQTVRGLGAFGVAGVSAYWSAPES